MVIVKNILALSAVAGGGVRIQRLDGATPPQPVGGALILTTDEWLRARNLLDLDLKVATATFEANRDGGDETTGIVWKP